MPSALRAPRGGAVRLTSSGSIITGPMPMPSKAKRGASSPGKGSWIYETVQQRRRAAHPSLNSAKRSRTAPCVPPPISGQIAPPGAPSSPSRRLGPLNPLLPIAPLLFSTQHTRPTSPGPESWNDPALITYVHFQLLRAVVS